MELRSFNNLCRVMWVFFFYLKLTWICHVYLMYHVAVAWEHMRMSSVFHIIFCTFSAQPTSGLQAFCQNLYFCVSRSSVCVTATVHLKLLQPILRVSNTACFDFLRYSLHPFFFWWPEPDTFLFSPLCHLFNGCFWIFAVAIQSCLNTECFRGRSSGWG